MESCNPSLFGDGIQEDHVQHHWLYDTVLLMDNPSLVH